MLHSVFLALALMMTFLDTGHALLAWDPVNDARVTGYRILSGPSSRTYTTALDVGLVSQLIVETLPGVPRTYFAVQSRTWTEMSAYSNEVFLDDPCAPPFGHTAISIVITKLQLTGSGGALSRALMLFQLASPNSPITHLALRSNAQDVSLPIDGTNLNNVPGIWFDVPATPGTYPLSVLAVNAAGCRNELLTSKSLTVK